MTTVKKPPLSEPSPDGKTAECACLAIALLCEDAECVRQSHLLLSNVLRRLPFKAEAKTIVLEFAELAGAQPLGQRQERDPSIVIVSAHGNRRLPLGARVWVQRWAGHRGGSPCALGAVFDPEHQWSASAIETLVILKKLARDANIDWIESNPNSSPAEKQLLHLQEQAGTVSTILDNIVRTSHAPTDLRRLTP